MSHLYLGAIGWLTLPISALAMLGTYRAGVRNEWVFILVWLVAQSVAFPAMRWMVLRVRTPRLHVVDDGLLHLNDELRNERLDR